MSDYKYDAPAPASETQRSRLYICAPVSFEDLRFFPDPPNAYMLGLVHSFEVTLDGPERGGITLTRFWNRSAENLISPSPKFFNQMRVGLKIQPGHSFNLYYQTLSHGLYLEGCDDSMATRTLRVDPQGEYEVTKFSYAKYRELPGRTSGRPSGA